MPSPDGKARISNDADAGNMPRYSWSCAFEKESLRAPRLQQLLQNQGRQKPHAIGNHLRTHGCHRATAQRHAQLAKEGRGPPVVRPRNAFCHRLLRGIQLFLMSSPSEASLNNLSLHGYAGDRATSAIPLTTIMMMRKTRVRVRMRLIILRTVTMPA